MDFDALKLSMRRLDIEPHMTLRTIRRMVEADLGVEAGACYEFKDEIKRIVTNIGSHDTTNDGFDKLKLLAVAMGAGPGVFRGLADADDKVAELRSRLIAKGATIKNDIPTAREISAAKAKRARAMDLDGIDVSNIIGGRRKQPRIKKTTRRVVDDSNDDEAEFV